jgi:tripartite-type tricarboxylate transporter receptor subunit TctC
MVNLIYWLGVFVVASAATFGSTSQAQTAPTGTGQTYPWKVIQIIVPSPAGSPPDARARELADELAPALGQAVIIVNKPGAGGAIGMQAGATSAADGHTLIFCTDAPLTVNPSVYDQLTYDPVKHFSPIMQVHQLPLLLVANSSVKANTLSELIQLAKSRPGKLFYGSV